MNMYVLILKFLKFGQYFDDFIIGQTFDDIAINVLQFAERKNGWKFNSITLVINQD